MTLANAKRLYEHYVAIGRVAEAADIKKNIDKKEAKLPKPVEVKPDGKKSKG